MEHQVHGWRRFGPAALVMVGWIFFLTPPMLENTWLKYLFLVAARALPRALLKLFDELLLALVSTINTTRETCC